MQTNLSINSIAMGNIRGRRRQYVLLITAIVLAVFFTATALLFASAMSTSLRERHYHRMGEQDAILLNCQDAPLEELLVSGVFSRYGTAEILGYVLPDGQNQANGFSIAVFDDTALNLAHNDPLEGRLPEKAGEIALEQSALARLRTDSGVGDTLKLTLMVPDGSGFMDSPVQNSYTLVGILNDKQVNLKQWVPNFPVYNDFPAGVLSAEEQIPPGGRAVINCYGRYASRDIGTSYEQLKLFCEEYKLTNDYGLANIASTSYQFSNRYYDEASNSIVTTSVFFMVIALVLVLAACLGIVNAFSASLESRKRQIGLLRAVGATKNQIRHIFGRETLLLSVFSIPLALVLSCLTVWGITAAMGDYYTFRPDPLLIAAAAAAGVLCVIPAAWIPLRKAARIPPMQAIREVELSRKIRKCRVESRHFFDVPRLIAHRSLTLYKNKQISITAMLAVSIVLMSLVVLVAAPVLKEAVWDYGADYQLLKTSRHGDWLIEYSINQPGITQQDKNDAAALSMVKTVTGEKFLRLKILTDNITPYITKSNHYGFTYLSPELQANTIIHIPEASQWEAQQRQDQQHLDYLESKAKYGYAQDYLTVDCCGVDAEVLEKLSPFVSAGRINIDRLSFGEEVLIIAPAEYGLYEENLRQRYLSLSLRLRY
ncbi:ABC transporter permease [Candidatus Contubernalis alkaliaceticus]|uniref:ABC transporter permease n=1 Tax=Candidatus Contubernalis alkaliaceticus TaxID=338645 RepID=UPI001F4C4C56|nr:FtsX-like permease family protein [Candidatus Contubernalis alkalaceticus]UNC91995.1 FtsX-like permease family protein [Candidatus Contubernalis alkalaceticus]